MRSQPKFTHVDSAKRVGRRLREARIAAGLSQRQLSFPGCTPAYISRIEKGERVPSLQVLRVFAERLGISESYLARGVDEQPRRDLVSEAELALRLGDIDQARELVAEAADDAAADADAVALLQAELAAATGDSLQVIELIEDVLARHPNIERERPRVADILGRAYAAIEEHENSLAVFTRNFEAAKEREDTLEVIRFGVLLANASIDSGSFARAEETLADVLEAARETRDPLARAQLFWSQSRLRALQNDAAAAARFARAALETLQASDHTYYAACAHQLLAHIELDRGNAALALELLQEGFPLIEQSGRRADAALFRVEEARALLRLGHQKDAAAVALEAAAALRQSSPLDAGRSFAVVAEVFDELGEVERAMEMYELAIESLEGTPTRYLVEAYGRLADLLERAGRQEEALELLKRGMRVQTTVGRSLVPR